MLGDLRDDVIALFRVHLGDALNGQIVRFGGAAGENNFLRRCADQIGNLLARFLDGFFGFPAEAVIA